MIEYPDDEAEELEEFVADGLARLEKYLADWARMDEIDEGLDKGDGRV